LAILSVGPFIVMIIGGLATGQVERNYELLLRRKDDIDWPVFISILLWALNGWDCMGNIASHVKNPKRTYPIGMTLCVILVMLSNVLPIAFGACIDLDWDSWQEGEFPIIANHLGGVFGRTLKLFMIIGALVSALGQQNIAILTTAESWSATCHRDILGWPAFIWLSRWETPWISLIFNSVIVLLITIGPFESVVAVDIFLYCCGLILELSAFLWLKFKQPNLPRAYVFPGGKIGAVLGATGPIIVCCFMFYFSDYLTIFVSVGCIVFSFVFYWFLRLLRHLGAYNYCPGNLDSLRPIPHAEINK